MTLALIKSDSVINLELTDWVVNGDQKQVYFI